MTVISAKDQRDPAAVALYEQHVDYLTAYRLHTDLRVRRDGPAAAIGGDWEAGGQRQYEFLIEHGVKPWHVVIDVGCGTGRLARWLVPYLMPGHYYGLDLSESALEAARRLASAEGWWVNAPHFLATTGTCAELPIRRIDVIWCYAVFIHLPLYAIEAFMASLLRLDFGACYFTYKPAPEPERTGLKQFAAPLSWYRGRAKYYGLQVEAQQGMPWLPQPLARLTRAEETSP